MEVIAEIENFHHRVNSHKFVITFVRNFKN